MRYNLISNYLRQGGAALFCGSLLFASAAWAQTANTATSTAQSTPATHSSAKRRTHRHRAVTQTLPIETAQPASQQSAQTTAAAEAQQRAADARLLKQQEAQSDKAAAINDKMVQRAQQRQDAQQNEVRIQDAPGPAQTGVVPLAGAPTQPAQTDQRIQDQPSAVPGSSTPNTQPPQA